MRYKIFFLFILVLICIKAQAQDSLSIKKCISNTVSIREVDKECFKQGFGKEITAKSFWLEITVSNRKEQVLLFAAADTIEMFYADTSFIAGIKVPKENRTIQGAYYALPVPAYDEPFYARVVSDQELNLARRDIVPLSYYTFYERYVLPRQNNQRFQYVFQGMLWIILLYNLLLFFTTKDRVYVAYAIYLLGLSIYSLQNYSLGFDIFFYQYPSYSLPFSSIGITLGVYGFISFMMLFLPPKTINKTWKKIFQALLIFTIVSGVFYEIALLYVRNITWFIYGTFIGTGTTFSVLLVFFVYLTIRHWKDTIVKFFVIGSFFIVAGALVTSVSQIYGSVIYYWLQLGGIIEVLIFSLGLGIRMKKLEEENASLLEEQNQVLEQKVNERTKEISLQKEEILVQNEELQQQQEEIITQRDQIELQHQELQKSNIRLTDSVRYA